MRWTVSFLGIGMKYLRIQEEPQKEKDILADLLKNLRERAIRLGYTIDAVFRNENDMSLPYQRMRFLMTDSAYGLDGSSGCFREVVDIYKKDLDWYQMILNKARKEAGLEVYKKEKKAPIIVVNGVRVDQGAPEKNGEAAKTLQPVPVIKHELVIREAPAGTSSSERSVLDRLHLAPALRRNLEEEGVHTIKALQHFLADYKNYMKKSDLRKNAGISSSSLAKLGKDENVTTEVLAKICNELKCDVADSMEFIPDENE